MINNFHKSVRQGSILQIFCQSFQSSLGLPLHFLDISGISLNFQDVSRIVGWGGRFHSQARNFLPLQVAEHFFKLEKEKIQDGQCAKVFPYYNGCFPGSGMNDSKEILEFY